jgi:hypothetical protein
VNRFRKVVVVIAVAVAGLCWWNSGGVAVLPPDQLQDAVEPRSALLERATLARLPAARVPALAAGPEAAIDERLVVPCFWFYVKHLWALPDTRARARELACPSRQLEELPEEMKELLGLRPDDVLAHDVELIPGSGKRLAKTIPFTLLGHWQRIANDNGEPLARAFLELFHQVVGGVMADADAAMLEFSCDALAHLRGEEDVRALLPSVLAAIRNLPPDRKLARVYYMEPLALVAQACRRFHWPRPDALALLDAPWITTAERCTLLSLMVVGTQYSDWATAVEDLLRSPDSGRRWAAIEALRYFVDGNGLAPERLTDLVPDAFFADADSTLRWAAVELVSEFGGDAGQRRLVTLLHDPAFVDKRTVLQMLAMTGKAPLDVCFAWIVGDDAALRSTAAFSLGYMSKLSESAFTKLCEVARSHDDPRVRESSIAGLGASGRDITKTLLAALRDPDEGVQCEAVRQLGQQKSDLVAPSESLAHLDAVTRASSASPAARRLAFQEVFLRSDDGAIPELCQRMLGDSDREIAGGGYLLEAALALGDGDQEALARWEQREIPTWVLEQHSLLRERADGPLGEIMRAVAGGGLKKEVVARIQHGLDELMDPRSQRKQDEYAAFLTMGQAADNPLLSRMGAAERRVMQYLRGRQRRR